MLQALGGCGAALGCVLQRGQEEGGEGSNRVFCPLVSVRQDAVEAAGGKPGDPQKSAWQRQRKHSTLITLARLRGCRSSPCTVHPKHPEGSFPSPLNLPFCKLHLHCPLQVWLSGVSQKSSFQARVWSFPVAEYFLDENMPRANEVFPKQLH